MSKTIQFIKALIFSAFAGSIVSLPVILLRKEKLFPNLVKGAIVGICIGMIIWLVFYLFFQVLKHSRILSFAVVVLFIGLGTVTGAYILGLRNINHYIIVTSLAEITGLTFAVSSLRNYMKFNRRLKKIQQEYSISNKRDLS